MRFVFSVYRANIPFQENRKARDECHRCCSKSLAAEMVPSGCQRKFEIYSMGWQNEINIENVSVAVAPYGGPIALIRDRKKFVKVQGIGKPIVSIYSASGKNISSIVWSSGQIIQLGWSSTEDLLCVQDDGSVLIYDMFGTYQHTFSVGQEVKDTKVIEAKIFSSLNGTGVAVLTSSYRIFVVNNVKDPKIRRLPEISSLNIPPSSWTVFVEDRQTRVLVAKDKDLYELRQSETHALPVNLDVLLVSSGRTCWHRLPQLVPMGCWFLGFCRVISVAGVMQQKPGNQHLNRMTYMKTVVIEQNFTETVGSIVEMAVSQNNRHVALFADNGRLWIGSADFRKRYCEFDTKCPSRPKQLVWCGTEAVISYWDNIVLVIGRQGDHINYSYDSAIRLVPEMDGVRVLSSYSHEMIQKVPQVVQQIFRINSTEPGSYLLEASKQFQKRSHRADEYIRLVKDDLVVAVKQCVEAAGYEFDTGNQKMLVRAAQFGKGFIPDLNSESYVKMCRLLRVLNAVRDHKIGIPLTYTQMQHLTIQVLLDRLVLRRHYYLAIQIAKYLKLPYNEGSSRILAHWACYKVKQTQLDREQVARDIADKLGYAPGVSYSDIAMKAADVGECNLP
ncbi:hypothetical protein ANN_25373 [Periplaneta americana]|uniref:Vps16 N-terminal domain-containing protein n=1 Tax=Periplaneta americana TaxID=6978 RepID=A0ABQ8S154_PERAM|nr:hypothetical protein ANN_25373 [Periplaneta americana]